MARPLDEEAARAAVKAAFGAVTADDVRVNIDASETGFLRYAVNEVTTSGQVTDVVTAVSCAVGNKHASVTIHGLRVEDVAAAARRALEQARIAPDDPEWVASPGAATMKPVTAGWSETAVSASDRAALVADSIGEAKKQGLTTYGFIQSQRTSQVSATRAGFFGMHHGTSVSLTTTARTPDGAGSGWASAAGIALAELDALGATRIACDKALRTRGAKALEPGVYPVVLEPAAVAAMLNFIGLDMRAADEGHSAFTKPGGGTRLGEKLFGSLTLKSDPWAPLEPSAPFDHEGMPRPPVTWVENGVLKKLRTSRYWAKKTKRSADARYDRMLPTGPTAESMESLIGGLDRGLLVTRLFYLRMLEPQSITVTGLTRDGVFLVEKGKIVGPVNNFRFNQSVLQMCADADGYGAPVRVSSGEGEGGPPDVALALRCKAFHMASKSDAV
ncbi:MAG: TldD/PmbA family protein [Myxococcales bacterium]|nr:TldD/PmbA family protein [Myxococcales bacterium]